MPDDPQPLDIARFKLDAFKTSVEMHTKLIKAYADYNFRMMEVLEKRVKIETDLLKMRILQDAFADFRMARRQNLRQVRSLDEKIERHSTALDRVAFLLMGQVSRQSLVSLGWRGFWYLVAQSSPMTVLAMGRPKCRVSDRDGSNWFRPAAIATPVPNAPSSITHSFLLMDWARKQQAVPNFGSPPLEKLAELLEILGNGAQDSIKELQKRLLAAEKELKRIRDANWRTMKLVDKEPKEE